MKKEGGLRACHELFTEPGDSLVIIGGGGGVTAVAAGDIVGEAGQVIVYEGGEEEVDEINETVSKQSSNCDYRVIHGIVGEGKNVYGGNSSKAIRVDPADLPQCDVLELDCEGAELDILRRINIRPRAIFVELHPWRFDESHDEIVAVFNESGYRIVERFGHDGVDIPQNEFPEMITDSKKHPIGESGKIIGNSGARYPFVIAAVRE